MFVGFVVVEEGRLACKYECTWSCLQTGMTRKRLMCVRGNFICNSSDGGLAVSGL